MRRKIALSCLAGVCLCFVFSLETLEAKKPPLRPVNINTASETELQKVPGIGPTTAKNIVHTRKSMGPFKSVDDLLAIPGIGRKRLDRMRKYLTVGKPPAAPKNAPPSGAGDKKEAPPAAPKSPPAGV